MYKIKIILFIISLIVGAVSFYYALNNLDYRIKISSFLAVPDMDFVNSNSIKKMTIKFSEEDKTHFNNLFKDFYAEGLGIENQNFLAYYSKNNNWRKTTLTINNKTYKVKIKAHGRTPYAQKFGKHFSLSIKFSEKPYPFYSKRVNLIIYNRIQLRSESLKLLANKFNLPTADFELVLAEIGSHEGSLYFVEERINRIFFKKRKLPWIIFNKGINGSLIYHGYLKPLDISKQLNLELEKKNE